MTIKFTKMHGLGNDFMVLDTIRQRVELTSADIKRLSDRNTGIGFDQCLIVEASPKEEVDFFYRIFNADGSEVGQCGNGARCLARYIQYYHLTDKKQITIATKTTAMRLHINDDETITVDMGLPKFHPSEIPFKANLQETVYPLKTENNQTVELYLVNVGNPHAALVVPNVKKAPVTSLGNYISYHPYFPEQVNVGFMEIVNSQHIKLRVYERGCGETLACGSGAVAAAALGIKYLDLKKDLIVTLPGGDLQIHWENPNKSIFLTGPATFVYEGILL